MEHGEQAFMTIVLAAGFGVFAQVMAHRWRIPAIVLLLGLGVVLGPQALGLVQPASLADGLSILVKLSVALILFEGALNLRLGELRHALTEVRNLVTVGVGITWLLTAPAVHYLAGFSWPVAILFGALMTVTGPTVVQPLLKRLHVSRRIKTILEGEAVLVDPIGAILAVAVMEGLLVFYSDSAGGLLTVLSAYFTRLLVGGVIGALGGYLLSKTLAARRLVPMDLSGLVVLTGVWGLFGVAEMLQPEAGLATSVAAGLIIQRESLPGIRQMRRFKETLTLLSLSTVFILLAANLDLAQVMGEGWRGVATVLVMMLLIRPVMVFLANLRSELSWREKLFIAWIGPRGIVAASVASLFGLALSRIGVAEGERLTGLVFLTIAMTVTLQGLSAAWVERLLGLTDTQTKKAIIVGAGPLGILLANILSEAGRPVMLIDRNPMHIERARCQGLDAHTANALDADSLERLGVEDAELLVAVTPNSEVNTLATQLARDSFGLQRAYPALDSPEKGAGPGLVQQSGNNVAFGGPIDFPYWENLARQRAAQRWVARAPEDWKSITAGVCPQPDGALPLARVRNKAIELVNTEQIWQAGDEIVFLAEVDEAGARAAMTAVGLHLEKSYTADLNACPDDELLAL